MFGSLSPERSFSSSFLRSFCSGSGEHYSAAAESLRNRPEPGTENKTFQDPNVAFFFLRLFDISIIDATFTSSWETLLPVFVSSVVLFETMKSLFYKRNT